MSAPTFTPGPWIVSPHSARESFTVRQQGDRRPIAEVWLNGDDPEANARLIAAAPEMFEALRVILADWGAVDPYTPVPNEINVNEHWDAVRAAIAKATGGAQ